MKIANCGLQLVVLGLLLATNVGIAYADELPAGSRKFAAVNRYVQERSVKIYGAGGLRQLEAYQSGILVSGEGHIATVSSLVLDQDEATVVLFDGRKYTAKLVGSEAVAEVALLKIDAPDEEFPHFDLSYRGEVFEGMRLLAFSNLYNVATGDEPVSVLHGSLSAIAPLVARRGAFSTRFRGEVYVLDAPTNNPGAAGGVLVDLVGNPLGMLGKEVRSELTGTWLNYALPLSQVASSVEQILTGNSSGTSRVEEELPEHPATYQSLGFRLVPNVVPRTPPFVDQVLEDSIAAEAGLKPDDLLVAIGEVITGSRSEVEFALLRIAIDQPVSITVLRGERLLEIEFVPQPPQAGR